MNNALFPSIKYFCKTSIALYGVSTDKRQILDSKLQEFADDNYKFDKYSRNFSRKVDNTVGKGKIACYYQFLFFPTVILKNLYCRQHKNPGFFGKRIIERKPYGKTICHSSRCFTLDLNLIRKPYNLWEGKMIGINIDKNIW